MPFQNELTNKITSFLTQIGIKTIPVNLTEETFLPGILVKDGKLLVDEEKLEFPGDLLHEAGHIAVAPASLRDKLSDFVFIPDSFPEVLETSAILWSYAVCVHLEIDPQVVFHNGGYRGRSKSLMLNFELGVFIGIGTLLENNMTFTPEKALENNTEPFPKMQKWMRD